MNFDNLAHFCVFLYLHGCIPNSDISTCQKINFKISNRNMYSDTDIAEKIQNHLHPDHVEVEDLSDGCGSKFKITVVSDKFDGKNSLACHRLVL